MKFTFQNIDNHWWENSSLPLEYSIALNLNFIIFKSEYKNHAAINGEKKLQS